MREMDERTAQALGKLAYERFAEERVARGNAMPPWTDPPQNRGQGLPASERKIWTEVALAVATHVPFVITDEVVKAASQARGGDPVRVGIRAAAEAAGFRVVER